jgi:guanine deaminase
VKLRVRTLDVGDDGEVRWCPDAFVQWEGPALTQVSAWRGEVVDEDLRPGVLLPGFVDAHVHWAQTRIVGSASGPLLDWLAQTTFPEEASFAEPAQAAHVAGLFLDALGRSGTTLALAYGPVFPAATEALIQAAVARGQALITGPVLMDDHSPEALLLPADRALPALRALAARYHGRDGIELAVIPRFALSCTQGMLQGAGALAAELGLRVSTHLSENGVECRIATERFGAPDYLAVYERAGLLQPGAVFAHCIHLSASEWARLQAAGAVVAHCPDSNDFLGSGGMPVAAWRASGALLAIGTDVGAGRSFRVPRILSAAYDNAFRQGIQLAPSELLWWGTRGGAVALGHPEKGLLEPGKDADMTLFTPPPWADTAQSVLAALLFDHDAGPMAATWVRGREVHGRTAG